MKNTPSDKTIKIIEDFFRVPDRVADKVKNVAEKVRGGYVLFPDFCQSYFVKNRTAQQSGILMNFPTSAILMLSHAFHQKNQNSVGSGCRSSGQLYA